MLLCHKRFNNKYNYIRGIGKLNYRGGVALWGMKKARLP
jgi:hypothetical protein